MVEFIYCTLYCTVLYSSTVLYCTVLMTRGLTPFFSQVCGRFVGNFRCFTNTALFSTVHYTVPYKINSLKVRLVYSGSGMHTIKHHNKNFCNSTNNVSCAMDKHFLFGYSAENWLVYNAQYSIADVHLQSGTDSSDSWRKADQGYIPRWLLVIPCDRLG